MLSTFISDNGDLVRIQDCKIIRKQYSYTFSKINNTQQLRATIRAGSYQWPGGYPAYLIFGDGEACCFNCARKEYSRIAKDMKDGFGSQFEIVGCDINYEDNDLYCSHCNKQIESAYGE